MYYAKWMERLATLDTKLAKERRRKEFWYIFEISGLFMNWEKGYYFWNLLYIGFLFTVISYYVPCLIVSMFKVSDLAEMCQYLNFMSLILIAQTMIIMGNFKRRQLLAMLSMDAQGFYDYGDNLNMAEIDESKKRFNLFKKIVLVVLPVWLILIAGSVMVSEYVDAVFAVGTTVDEEFVNGMYQRLPLKMWYFHTIDSEYKRYLSILSEIICSSEMAMAICAGDLFLIFLGQSLIIQMKKLVIAIRDTDFRAERNYKKATGNEPPDNPIARRKDPELMKNYRNCLRQTIEHHKAIISYFEMYQDFLNWPFGVAVVNGSILVAMSTISLMQGEGRPSLIVTSCLLIIAEIASLFLMCEYGQNIKNMGEHMFNAMYQVRWRDCSKEVVADMMIMRTRMAEPLILQGVLTPLNRDTFGTIMNTAYSYINLMRASERG